MRELFWTLVALLLSEAGEHCAPWAERLIYWASRALPEHKRERQLARWLGDLDAVPGKWSKLGFALHMTYSAHRMRERKARTRKRLGVRSSSRVLLGLQRANAVLLVTVALLVDVLNLFSSTPDLTWMVGLNIGALLFAALVFRGGGFDWPWLRSTRAGAAVQLAVVFIPALLLLGGLSFPLTVHYAWFGWSAFLMTWDLYWEVTRPLPRRGLLLQKT